MLSVYLAVNLNHQKNNSQLRDCPDQIGLFGEVEVVLIEINVG